MSGKTLLFLRHAKSSWDDPALEDFHRPLADRGRKAAPIMAREMKRRGWLPDMAVISSSVRTRQTWQLVADALPMPVPATFDETLYEAPAERILDTIRKTDEAVATLLVVGHNPGLEDLSRQLASDDSDDRALSRLVAKFPAAAMARFRFEGGWRELQHARLEDFVKPRDL
ncbi:histidine phosphatase family protein [Mesorhizobium sp. CAU 1741]|uniref:SixA phosphatase family protein n=1 Tax=Mesorhizobium sp. CAU 1741 TaxID=3140366 RepID=UPI00325B84AB